MLRTVIRLAIAILVILVLLPVVAKGAEIISGGGCTISHNIMSALYSMISKEPLPSNC